MKKVLITGAGGFLGRYTVEAFLGDGHIVRVSDMPGTDLEWANELGAKVVLADLTDKDALIKVVEGMDIIIHLAAIFDFAAPKDLLRRVNIEGARNIMDAAIEAGIGRFIHMSTVGIYGRPRSIPCNEDEPKRPRNNYEATKCAAEGIAMEFYKDRRLPIVILRPTLIYGPRSKYGLAMMLGLLSLYGLRGLKFPTIDTGPWVHNVHAADVVGALRLASTADGIEGEAFNVADETPLRTGDFMRILLEATGIKEGIRFRYIPPLWKALFSIFKLIPRKILSFLQRRVLKRWDKIMLERGYSIALRPRLDKDWVDYMLGNTQFDIEKIKTLGLKPEYPDFRDGFLKTVEWYRKNKWIL